jgi:hypothetical protein
VSGERSRYIYLSLTGHSINLLKLTAGAQRHQHHVPSEFSSFVQSCWWFFPCYPAWIRSRGRLYASSEFRHGRPTRKKEGRVDGFWDSEELGLFYPSMIRRYRLRCLASAWFNVQTVSQNKSERSKKFTCQLHSLIACENPGVHAVQRRRVTTQ